MWWDALKVYRVDKGSKKTRTSTFTWMFYSNGVWVGSTWYEIYGPMSKQCPVDNDWKLFEEVLTQLCFVLLIWALENF